MQNRNPYLAKSSTLPTCPVCQGSVGRVRRSLFDRFLGLFVARGHVLYRYECCATACAWTGSLQRSAGGRNVYGAAGSRRHVLDAAQMSEFRS